MRCPRCHADNSDASRFCAECGTALQGHRTGSPEGQDARRGEVQDAPLDGLPTKTIVSPAAPVSEGDLLAGKYRVIDEIDPGGMGVVLRAEDTRLKRTVALKFLSP